MNKFRLWLIKKLIGNNSFIYNAIFYSPLFVDRPEGIVGLYVLNNKFLSSPENTPTLGKMINADETSTTKN